MTAMDCVADLLPPVDFAGENAMLPALVSWLLRSGRIRDRTGVAYEVPWLGRRVDLALVNSSGVTTAFELKVGSFSRVLEQAAYNAAGFNRSWIVTGNVPRPDTLALAVDFGIGVLSVQNDEVELLALPRNVRPNPVMGSLARRSVWAKAIEV